MLLDPGQDVGEVEDGALRGADRVFEGLERDGAEVEGQALEAGARGGVGELACVGTSGGAEGIFGGPFAVRDLSIKVRDRCCCSGGRSEVVRTYSLSVPLPMVATLCAGDRGAEQGTNGAVATSKLED